MDYELRSYTLSRIKWGLLGGVIFSTVVFSATERHYEQEHYRLMNLQCQVQASKDSILSSLCRETIIGEIVATPEGVPAPIPDTGFIF